MAPRRRSRSDFRRSRPLPSCRMLRYLTSYLLEAYQNQYIMKHWTLPARQSEYYILAQHLRSKNCSKPAQEGQP